MLFDKILDNIKVNKSIKESGKFVDIPMPLKRLSEHIPSIEKGQSIGVLAGTGVGKSRFVRWLFIYKVIEFAKKTGYPVKIFYFPLEDNKEKVYNNFICNYLKEKHDITVSTHELQSRRGVLSERIIKYIEEAKSYFEDFEKYVYIFDTVSHPDSIYQVMLKYASAHGTIQYKNFEQNSVIKQIPSKYKPNKDEHVIMLIDNMSNFDAEKSAEERELMIRFSKLYSRKILCNVFKYTVVQVMQMSFDKERQQFTNSGMTVVSKLEPSLDGIGEAKVIARSMHLILGLFNPDRYELKYYPNESGYKIDILKNNFRAINVIKANDSQPGLRVGLLFDPLGETFEELPLPSDPEINSIYLSITNKKYETKDLFKR